jgi:hypothetical protein
VEAVCGSGEGHGERAEVGGGDGSKGGAERGGGRGGGQSGEGGGCGSDVHATSKGVTLKEKNVVTERLAKFPWAGRADRGG